ncbi:testis-expressed sequence 15 protein [Arapaima gigas]
MEALCSRRTDAPLADLNTTGKGALKNFTIPRKRRAAGTSSSFLEPCSKDSREYSFILSTLNDSRLNPNKHFFLSSDCQQVKLVHNEELLREFSEKRSEMRSKGRNVREMEEKFCFLVESAETMERLCEQGLKVDNKAKHTLGNPMHGVCLYRHVDVALKNTSKRTIIIFKVILGKVKRMPKNCILDPIIHYDSYISKDPAGLKNSLLQQTLGSSVYFFDYNENQELNTRPRQCLPYAVVTVDSIGIAFSAGSSNNLVLPAKIPSVEMSPGSSKPFKTCTLAERQGKGQNATVTFRQLGGLENFMYGFGYNSPLFETAPPFQRVEQMNTHQTTSPATLLQNGDLYLQQTFGYCTLQQQWGLTSQAIGQCAASPVGHTSDTAAVHDVPGVPGSSSEVSTSIYMSRNKKFPNSDLSTAVQLSNFSTTVFSSRVVRDPRLFRKETSNLPRTSLVDTHQDIPTGQKKSELRHGSSLMMNFNNSDQVWSLSSPEHKCLKTGLQKITQTVSLGTDLVDQTNNSCENNSCEQSASLPGLCNPKYPGNTSENVEHNSIDERKTYDSFRDMKEVGADIKDNKETETEQSARNAVAVEIKQNNALPKAGSLAHTEHLLSDNCQKNLVDKQHSSLQFVQHVSRCGKDDLQLQNSHKQSPDLKKNHINMGKHRFVKELTSLLTSPKLSENTECMEVYEKNSSPVAEETQIPVDRPDLDQSETCKSINNCQNSEPSHISESVRSEDSRGILCSSSSMEKREVQNEEFISVARFEEINDLDDLHKVHFRKSDVKPDVASIQAEISVQNPSNECPNPEGTKIEDSSIISNEVTSVQQAKGDKRDRRMSDALLRLLYKRMQFSEMSVSGQEEQPSDKPYLKPRHLENRPDKDICLSPLKSVKHTNKKYNLRITIKANNTSAGFLETHTLSERIPFTQSPKKKKETPVVLDEKSVSNTSVTEVINNGKKIIENLNQVLRDKSGVTNEAHSAEGPNVRLVEELTEKYEKSKLSLMKRKNKTKPKRAVNKVSANCEPLLTDSENTDDKLVHQSVPVSSDTLCFVKGQEECNSENGLSSNRIDDYLSVAQSAVQDLFMADCTTVEPCECRASRNCKLKKAETLKKTRGPRKWTGKATQYLRKKPRVKWLLYNKNNVQLMSGWRNKKILTSRFMLLKYLQRGQLKSCGDSRKTKINIVKKESVKQKGNKNSVGNKLATFTVGGKKEALSEDKGTEMKTLPANLSGQAASMPRECTSSPDSGSKGQNEAQLLDINNDKKSDKLHSLESMNRSEKTEQHLTNEKHLDEHMFHSCSTPVFTCRDSPVVLLEDNGKERMAHELEKHLEDSQTEMHLSMAPEEIVSNDGTALHTDTLPPSGPQEKVVSRLNAYPVNIATVIEDKDFYLQEHEKMNKTSSKIRLITKLRCYLQKNDSLKKVLQSDNVEVLNDGIFPLTLETSEKVIPILATQQPESEICSGLELPYYNPEGGITSSERRAAGFSCSSDSDPAGFIVGPSKADSTLFSNKTSVIVNNRNVLTETKQNGPTSLVGEKRQNQGTIPTIDPCDVVMSALAGNDDQRRRLKVNENNQEDVHFELNTNIPAENPAHKSGANETVKESEVTMTERHRNYPTRSTTSFQAKYGATDISVTLRKADNTASMEELLHLKCKCKEMLQFFISTFEKDQNISFSDVIVSKDLILDRYLYHPPKPVDLKFEALYSFFELQMMMEAMEFVENKIRHLSGEPTFRSLLWYDHSLFSELCTGRVKNHVQSSMYPSVQENISSKGNSCLQKYKSVLHHQLARSSDASYYMYLKNRREELELQAALKNNFDSDNFNMTVPLTCSVNLGDTLQSLEVLQKRVSTFTDAYFGHLQSHFDGGIAEHLSILCRLIDEKMKYLKACRATDSQVPWFGLEHLCYDASKVLVWKSSKEKLTFHSLAVSLGPTQKTIRGLNEAELVSSKIKTRKDTVSTRRNKSHQFMTSNKKKRQLKHSENIPLIEDFIQNEGRPGNTPSAQNSSNEVGNPAPKYTKNHGNQLLSESSGSNGSSECQTWNWATSDAELLEKNSASAQLHNRMTTFLPPASLPPGNLSSSEKPCGKYNTEWPSPSPVLHPKFIKSGALQPCYDICAHMHTCTHDIADPQHHRDRGIHGTYTLPLTHPSSHRPMAHQKYHCDDVVMRLSEGGPPLHSVRLPGKVGGKKERGAQRLTPRKNNIDVCPETGVRSGAPLWTANL